MSPPYRLEGVWSDGVRREIAHHTTLEAALIDRDKRRNNTGGHTPALFRVFDNTDESKGEADWCPCRKRGVFGGGCGA